MKYKMIALDMDGTLLNRRGEVSAANKQWIRAAVDAGVVVCLATGRGAESTFPYTESLGLTHPAVTVNGSEIWKEPHVLHSRLLMDVETIKQLKAIADRYDSWFWGSAVGATFNNDSWPADFAAIEWLKFGYECGSEQKTAQILEVLPRIGEFELTNSSPTNIEVNPNGINKSAGLREVCKMLGISMAEVVAVGDSMNDIAMIRDAGLGAAMGNAQHEVKTAADVVTGTNEEDGVAMVIRDYVLGG